MRKKALLFVAVVFFLAGMSPGLPAQAEDALTVKAREFLAALEKGDFKLAARDFDETMLKVSGPDKLEALWTKQLPAQLGGLKKQAAARREQFQGYEIVLITCEFEKATLDTRVVFDKAGKIAGFGFVPTAPPAKYEPPSYADPAKFVESDVVVGSGEWQLPGTLTMPKGAGPFPGLVLVHGSGPNDRNESLGPNRPFQDLAWGLATRGIAVLRYDKRSKVHGAKILADPKLEATMTVKDETIDDALAAAALLQKTAKVDGSRVCILGHSLGGFLMPRIALAAASQNIAGFISMAGLTRPLDDTILRQMDYLYGLAGGSVSEDDKKKLQDIKDAVAKVKALTDADASSTIKLLGAMPAYWLDLRGYDPPGMAKTVAKPMLFLQGGRDYQVTTEDFENWKAVMSSRKDVEFHLYPKLNHLFYEGEGVLTPLEYVQKHGSVALYVIEDIAAWILER
ncbi:MAG: alpha/beta fold hydrolase [Candidatus Aminicenantes bacterium]|nr:alpha/beta fold hydrolase [Candidatus Aminicenantes bacterium]TFG56129.1 MAG: alpha/beta fold hydrolase [Candidatus Aminicenantes bacterium]